MQFYDPLPTDSPAGTGQGICQETDYLCDSDPSSYPRLDKTRRANAALEEIVAEIIQVDGLWQWDDSNRTDLPIGTQTLVEGQSVYSFNDKFLQLLEVQVKDVDGHWHIIQPIDQKEYSSSTPLEEDFATAGLPEYYDKVTDDTIKLLPAPTATACTLASGLKIKFQRTANLFTPVSTTAADTTQPGFVSPYHIIIAYMMAIPYCMTYKKDRVATYERKVGSNDPRSPVYGGLKKQLIELYSRRERDKRKVMTFSQRSFR